MLRSGAGEVQTGKQIHGKALAYGPGEVGPIYGDAYGHRSSLASPCIAKMDDWKMVCHRLGQDM